MEAEEPSWQAEQAPAEQSALVKAEPTSRVKGRTPTAQVGEKHPAAAPSSEALVVAPSGRDLHIV